MSEDIEEKLKCPQIEYLRKSLNASNSGDCFTLYSGDVRKIIKAFDIRNEEIIWRKHEMQKRIDQGKVDAQAEYDKQMALAAVTGGLANIAGVLAVFGSAIKEACGDLVYNVLLAGAEQASQRAVNSSEPTQLAEIDLERFHAAVTPEVWHTAKGLLMRARFALCDQPERVGADWDEKVRALPPAILRDEVGGQSDTQEPRDNGR